MLQYNGILLYTHTQLRFRPLVTHVMHNEIFHTGRVIQISLLVTEVSVLAHVCSTALYDQKVTHQFANNDQSIYQVYVPLRRWVAKTRRQHTGWRR